VSVVAVGGLLAFLQSRDESTITDEPTVGDQLPDQGAEHRRPPAGFRFASDPPTSGPHLPEPLRRGQPLTRDQMLHALELGNVVILYGPDVDADPLRALRDEIAGPFDPVTAEVGAAIILSGREDLQGVVALAWRRLLRTPTADDPRLRDFADAWLGRGAGAQ
jgi:Protein of unknown function (DUF3105)